MTLPPPSDIAGNQAFFGPRAATWEDRFPDDGPRYARAVAELAPRVGGLALDIGCGTGRALPYLAAAVGDGLVIGLDLTAEMLAVCAARGRPGALVQADAAHLPLTAGCGDAIFAAGLVHHLPDPVAGLLELARIARPGARLALFHPIGRAVLAARHGHDLDPSDFRSAELIGATLAAAGWTTESIDDGPDRYLVVAVRR